MDLIRQPLLINGEHREPSGGEYLDVVDPATGRMIGYSACATDADVDCAVTAAKVAFHNPAWRNLSPSQRADLLVAVVHTLGAHVMELAQLESISSGGSIKRLLQLDFAAAAQIALNFAEKLPQYPFVEYPPIRPLPEAHHVKVVKEPLGVCALITPWNAPLLLFLFKAIPALAAGNTVVVKPAENTSLGTFRMVELMQSFLPPGVLNIVTGHGAQVGDALTGHPDVAKISFTGSTTTGRHIQQRAAGTLKRVTLELGGKGPAIVLPDADLELTARGVVFGFMLHSGQACISGTRLIVHESIHDALVERCVELVRRMRPGSPMDPATTLLPMASEAHMKRVLNHIEAGRLAGARVAVGGQRAEVPGFEGGFFIEPTIFTGVRNDMRIAREEIFGPVLSVIKYSDLEEAIAIANDTSYGLSAGIWTGDPESAYRYASRLQAGTVWINDWHAVTIDTPFGGYKQSGFGKEVSIEAIEGYLQSKSIIVSYERRAEFKVFQQLVHGPVAA